MIQSSSSTLLAWLRALAASRPIAMFLVAVLGLVYPLMALIILAQRGVIPGAGLPARLAIDAEEFASLLLTLLGLLPATLLVTALEGGRPALRTLFRRVFRWRIGITWWAIAVAALPATTVAVALLLGDSLQVPSAGVLASELAAVTIAFLLVNLWEETAWTGFLQTRLERRHSFLVAAALSAVPFAAVHLPLRLISGPAAASELAQAFGLYLVLGLIVRPLLGLVLRGSGDSVFAAALMHTLFNRSNNPDGIAADLLIGPNRQLAALIAVLLLSAVIGLFIRRKLTRAYRQELDTMSIEPANPALSRPHQRPV